MWFLYVLLVIVALVVGYLVAAEFQEAAEAKGWPEEKYKWIAFLIPIAGYLLVAALPDRGKTHTAGGMGQSEKDAAATLQDLAKLHDTGALTDEEYEKMRTNVLKEL